MLTVRRILRILPLTYSVCLLIIYTKIFLRVLKFENKYAIINIKLPLKTLLEVPIIKTKIIAQRYKSGMAVR